MAWWATRWPLWCNDPGIRRRYSGVELHLPHIDLPSLQRVTLPLQAISTITAGTAIDTGITYSQQTSHTLGLVNQPLSAAARGVKFTPLQATARFLSKALPIVTIGAGALVGAQILDQRGGGALLHSRDGRAAALGVVGGTMLLIPTPVTEVAAAGVLTLSVANELGGLRFLDRDRYAPVQATQS